jgi:hypothetical protein
MRHRLVIIITVALVIGILIALNAANYARPKQEPESELSPNRSTYNAGPTGTRALYDLLSESGFQVTRWREGLIKLSGNVGAKVGTFVIVGGMPRPISEEDSTSLLQWVEHGGRLVIIDRTPNLRLLPKSGQWTFYTESLNFPETGIDPANSDQMTAQTDAVHPSQPTLLTRGVQSIRPSHYASVIRFKRSPKVEAQSHNSQPKSSGHQTRDDGSSSGDTADSNDEEEPGDETASPPVDKTSSTAVSPAPVVHAITAMGALLIDYPHGRGRVIVLCDPYIVSNGGIKLADNLQLALNALTQSSGLIAFDEYHQGHSVSENALAVYFASRWFGLVGVALAVRCLCRKSIGVQAWNSWPRWPNYNNAPALSIWRLRTFTRAPGEC